MGSLRSNGHVVDLTVANIVAKLSRHAYVDGKGIHRTLLAIAILRRHLAGVTNAKTQMQGKVLSELSS